MVDVMVFPDIEAKVADYLAAALSPVEVVTRVPDERPAEFIRIVRVGGSTRNLVTDAPVVVVECWATTTTTASELAANARALVTALPQADDFVRRVVEVGGPAYSPDPDSETPRYIFSHQIDTRGIPYAPL